jgi:hypothetical protein
MINFITLFDKNYLSRGLALYSSLMMYCDDFFLYILALDSDTEDMLIKETHNNVSVISLTKIESFYPELINIKQERTRAEYCWTLTPYSIQYAIKKFDLDSCTYVDADIFFYSDPRIIFNDAGDNSIIITEHRYTPEYDQTKTSGKYCVQFMYFKNDKNGMETLEWWRQRCKEWCYARCENGKFGDQKYLDDWITRFKGVYVPTHIGCGLAPWNIQQYDINIINDTLYAQDKITKETAQVIFFHFHGIKNIHTNQNEIIWHLSDYRIDSVVKEVIYSKYIKNLSQYNEPCIDLAKKIQKPTFCAILFMVIKDIIKSFFIFDKYNYYKRLLNDKYFSENIKV